MKIQKQTERIIIPKPFAHVVNKKILRHALTQKEPNFLGIKLKFQFIDLFKKIFVSFPFRYTGCVVIGLESARLSHIFSDRIEWFNESSLFNIVGNVQQFHG